MCSEISELKDIQQELDRRTETEQNAEKLIALGQFSEASKLLNTI